MDDMSINVTDTYNRAGYVDIIDFNALLLDQPPACIANTRGDMLHKLRSFLQYIRDHASVYIYGKHYTGVSIRKLSSLYGGSWTTWEKYIHQWIEWGLLGRPDHSVSENNIFEINARIYAELTDKKNATTMYTVNRWTREQLDNLRPIKGSGTKADTIHRRGQAEANRIWGDQRKISAPQQTAEEMILYRIKAEIDARGYCTRGALRQKVHVVFDDKQGQERRIKIDNVFDDMREVLTAEGLRYGAPTVEIRRRIKDQFGTEINGKEWIITRASESERNKAEGGEQ